MTPIETLALPMPENNRAGASTVRSFFVMIAAEVWHEADNFCGKRPLGYSDWADEVYAALIWGGAIDGTVKSDGEVVVADYRGADALILEAVKAL